MKQLKSLARGQLLGKYPITAAAFMSVTMMTIMTRLLLGTLISGDGVLGFLFSTVISFIVSLFVGVLNVGALFMALKICCNEPIFVTDIFYGFNYQLEKIIKIQAILSLANLILTLPAAVLQNIILTSGNREFLTTMFVFYIAGYGVYFFISLMFSQIFFLLLDFDDKSVQELFMKSHLIMTGHKKRLFMLWLSFVPLLLVSILTCCLGFIWVIPYIKVTLANFYMDLMQNRGSDEC
ncbi:MAG: DUF975 family protein [Lachnospiraceae bacterium]|nr:DUF975 family protein [Lachnospiraceae bacterium]